LHSDGEFDIIAAALQMSGGQRYIIATVLVVLVDSACSHTAVGQAANDATLEASDPEPGTTRKEILHTLQEVERKYGRDAVLMQGHLLGQAVRSGSVLAAEIGVAGVEEREGKRFLTFKLDTGIVYNDRDVVAAARSARVWSDIVEGTLRQFRTLSVPADGVAVLVGYTHKPYADLADLRAHLGEGHGDPEAVAFYVLLSDVAALNADHLTAQQLVDRSAVLVNGVPTRIVLEELNH